MYLLPHVPVELRDRLACVDVDELSIDGDRDTRFILGDVFTDELSKNVWVWVCQV